MTFKDEFSEEVRERLDDLAEEELGGRLLTEEEIEQLRKEGRVI